MKRALLLIIYTFIAATAAFAAKSPTADEALKLYNAKDYAAATRAFKAVAKEAPTAAVYYNLGNCYYRQKDLAHAVLNYRRALRLDPSDRDAAFNLELVQTKLEDRFDERSEMFFVTWTRDFISAQSATAWGYTALSLLVAAFAFGIVYLLGRRVLLQKIGFGLGLLFLCLSLLSLLFAYLENTRYDGVGEAVVLRELPTFDDPSASAKKGRTLHEGTLLIIRDQQENGWSEVEIPDGTTCWAQLKGATEQI